MTAAEADCVTGGVSTPPGVATSPITQQQHQQDVVFPSGAIVQLHTKCDECVTGKVLCYDHATRLLVLNIREDSRPEIRFFNLALVQRAMVVKSPPLEHTVVAPFSTTAQARERLAKAKERKLSSLPQVDVSRKGQVIFLAVSKTMEKLRWDGDRIVVLDQVSICPPYSIDQVHPFPNLVDDTKAKTMAGHIKSIIGRHTRDTPSLSTHSTPDRSFSSVDGTEPNSQIRQNGPQ